MQNAKFFIPKISLLKKRRTMQTLSVHPYSPVCTAVQSLVLVSFVFAASFVLSKTVHCLNLRWHDPTTILTLLPSSCILLANMWAHLQRIATASTTWSASHLLLPDIMTMVDYACLDFCLVYFGAHSLIHCRDALDKHFIANKAKQNTKAKPIKGC